MGSGTSDGGSPEVVPVDGGWQVLLGGRPQSFVDLDDPTRLAYDYVRRAGDVLDSLAPPGERLAVLHVGGAGLTLPRYVAATRPGSRQVVLEPDVVLTTMVREHLPLERRSGVKVRDVDGRGGLAAIRADSFDACVLDAFDADGRTPAELLSLDAVEEYRRVLGATGTLVANLRDSRPHRLTRDLVAALAEGFGTVAVGAEPATWKGRRDGNLLVVAGPDAHAATVLDRVARTRASPYRVDTGRRLSDVLGGGTARRDV